MTGDACNNESRAKYIPWKTWYPGLLFVGLFAVVGLLCLCWGASVLVFRCQRLDPYRVDCHVERRLLGIIPLRTWEASNVIRAETEFKNEPNLDGGSTENFRVVLIVKKGFRVETPWMVTEFGTDSYTISKRINQFIDFNDDRELRMWQGEWLPLVVGTGFLAFPLLVAISVLRYLRKCSAKC